MGPEEDPWRGESFSLEHLEQHAEELAKSLTPKLHVADQLRFFERVSESARVLRRAYQVIARALRDDEVLNSDAEWLLDNFNVVEDQLREIIDDLPRSYFRQLPKLADGEPRGYVMARELIIHTDSALDREMILRFVQAFQSTEPLSMGEIWAFPIMLRFGLVENLRRLATQMLAERQCRANAERIIHAWTTTGEFSVDLAAAEQCAPLILHLLKQLQEGGVDQSPRLAELERRLMEHGHQPASVIRVAHQRQAMNQVSIGNVITSMRLISALDWTAFFEAASLVEHTLRKDPAHVYSQMDAATRDRYRHIVEDLAKGSKCNELEVAERVVALAQAAEQQPSIPAEQRHVGYYLVDVGRHHVESALAFRPSISLRFQRWLWRNADHVYVGAIVLLTTAVACLPVLLAAMFHRPFGAAAIVFLFGLIPASELAVHFVNLAITTYLPPRLLPKLEFREGLPDGCATFVVVPALLTSQQEVDSLVQRLESHYLGNCEPALRFALLTDFTDGESQEHSMDARLLNHAVKRVAALNRKYGRGGVRPFYLLHRGRRWNPSEGVWMGWERKRGKLTEFNRLLRGVQDTTFETFEGDVESLLGGAGGITIRYVITLDADTQLPPGSARRLIGAMAHPLNAPRFDSQGRCISGYVILQPRIGLNLASATRSWFSRILANNPGIDPYITAASDVYQDLFGEGSFTGKGIYDLQTFGLLLDGVFPENTILSHDLIEGCHVRVGLVSDIELIDSQPARYEAEARRQHRWVRGDWQLLPWLLPRVPTPDGYRRNPLSILSRWKIIDNLRRSLVAPAVLLYLFTGWLAFPELAPFWTLIAVVPLVCPFLIHGMFTLRAWPRGVAWSDYQRFWLQGVKQTFLQSLLTLTMLPHRAFIMLDAILSTLTRLLVTRRKLLEWETAAATERRLSQGQWWSMFELWVSPILAILAALCLTPSAILFSSPFLIAWLLAPIAAHWVGHPVHVTQPSLTDEQRKWLRMTARRTWSYFEQFVTESDHWLPPDNFQEYPRAKIAHRVSPTNEGLFLVSAFVARDFGYLSLPALVDIWNHNLASWTKLERLRGHFFNWYDTETLQPLLPRYISTVDSGNLLACFQTLEQGIAGLRRRALFDPSRRQAILDAADCVWQSIEAFQPRGHRLKGEVLDQVLKTLEQLEQVWNSPPQTLREWQSRIAELKSLVPQLADRAAELRLDRTISRSTLTTEIKSLEELLKSVTSEFESLFAWTSTTLFLSEVSLTEPTGYDIRRSTAWHDLLEKLESAVDLTTLQQLPLAVAEDLAKLRHLITSKPVAETPLQLVEVELAIGASVSAAAALDEQLCEIAQRMDHLGREMDFGFLYNSQRKLFSIGFNLEDGHLDRAHYDMLASEARLASYIAIGKGDVEFSHWFHMGRPLTEAAGHVGLLSWGGTMFEYLMPLLFQRQYEDSLLEHSCRMAVGRQIEHGTRSGVPWGISESAFGALAANSDYHYRSFGVPGLGLKRGLGKDMVVSPYSTMLALEIEPEKAFSNLQRLADEGGLGAFGFYDALDYSPGRVPDGKRCQVVRCFMAHHQGMSLVAMANLLHDQSIRRLFHSHPIGRVAELLLQERLSTTSPRVETQEAEDTVVALSRAVDELVSRRIVGVDTAAPRTHLLSNSQYSVMLTNTGGGYSQCQGVAVSRWRCDATRDHWGQFCYLRDLRSDRVWSATFQPTRARPDDYEVIYSIDKAEFRRRDGGIETHLEVAVSPECNAELRQLKITNHSAQSAFLEVTSYCEIVLDTLAADLAHSAFQKLFVETEYVPERTALLAHRRPRDTRESPIWGVHVLAVADPIVGTIEYETSRAAFLGRRRSLAAPRAMDPGVHLSRASGAVLDPIFSLRCKLTIPPHTSVSLAFTTALCPSREKALALADQHRDPRGIQREFELAWAFNQVELRHLHLSPAKAHLFQRLAAPLFYPETLYRALPEVLQANRQGQSGLWRYGISGDLPILLIHVNKSEQLDLVRELLSAHQFWAAKGLMVDLALMNDHPGSYLDALHEQLIALLEEFRHPTDDLSAHRYVLRSSQIPREDQLLISASAMLILRGDRGSLLKQLEQLAERPAPSEKKVDAWPVSSAKRPSATTKSGSTTSVNNRQAILEYSNGFGGFAVDGSEYLITLSGGRPEPPMPWSNIIANPRFGCLVTESGGGYTWAENSREFKLTTWANDPVADPPSEWLYLKDEASGTMWHPLPQGGHQGSSEYDVQHGHGYSIFSHLADGIDSKVEISIAPNDPIKFVYVSLENRSQRPRLLALTYCVEWVLGVSRERSQMHVATGIDSETNALLASNPFQSDFAPYTAFLHVVNSLATITGDRAEFIGRNGDDRWPVGLRNASLSGRTGAGLDPCGALQTKVSLASGGRAEIIFLLGAGASMDEVRSLVDRYSRPELVRDAMNGTRAQWKTIGGVLQVKTPNRAFDILVNHWLLYQTISCRMWGRTAYYQAGGAYGFRDQLQDSMAVVYSRPDLTRAHLLRAAARQFEEGDVQHWWHPPMGRGIRTRFSDDYLWLPLVVEHYVRITGDKSVLDEVVPFLRSPQLDPHEQERYETPDVSTQSATLYEHCMRTLRRAFRMGEHGLPLIGCGDWNDGLNKVGAQGRGESVWVGWFLLVILKRFLPLVLQHGDTELASELEKQGDALRHAIESTAWDGQWYRRAYFDDGTPLGSRENLECQIDALAQTWSVFADGNSDRARQAMESVWQNLVREKDKVVLLFTPPFDTAPEDPGYIRGYLPGIRENGGQYTHSALWVVQAFASLGQNERAWKLFDLINPIHHTATSSDARRYQIEPYVAAADVYGAPPNTGRGGWSWYTGSAAWMYRVAIESLLGIQLAGNKLRLKPHIPASWSGFEFTLRRGKTLHQVIVQIIGQAELESIQMDGKPVAGTEIELSNDAGTHQIVVRQRQRNPPRTCPEEVGSIQSTLTSSTERLCE